MFLRACIAEGGSHVRRQVDRKQAKREEKEQLAANIRVDKDRRSLGGDEAACGLVAEDDRGDQAHKAIGCKNGIR